MKSIDKAIDMLNKGNIVKFRKKNGNIQTFKVTKGKLLELKEEEGWIERMYLPRWEDLKRGSWIFE